MGFRLLRVRPSGLALIVGAGVVLGLGIARFAGWPALPGAFVGVVLLWLVLRAFDRRAWRKSLVVIRLDLNRNAMERLAADLRAGGLDVAASSDPAGIRCRGRLHDDVVAAIRSRTL